MVAGCGMKIVKLLMFAINFTLWAAGCVILGLGAWIKAYESEYQDLLGSENIQAVTIIMICTGCAIFAIGFCGCCGAWKERPIFLKIYFVLVIAAIITELVAGIMALVYRDDVFNDINGQLSNQLETQYGEATAITNSIDKLQEDLLCCGATNYTDYAYSEWAKENPATAVPISCCKKPPSKTCNAGVPGQPDDVNGIYVKGCVDEMSSWINDNLTVLGGVCLGLLGVQFLALMFSCCLIQAIERDRKD
ncbi:CD151 antigen-like [Anneissia japonica]|uniref:CD151 antigen-like n=1 Tax=Anneissia japonica TaxID=1529436 RepID=UPI00142551AA|nr:CD151 antigen-like [Anneissia japonica]